MKQSSSIKPSPNWFAGLQALPVLSKERGALHQVEHELRGPLTVISAYAELLADQVSGELNETQREQAETILKSADQLSLMIERLTALAECLLVMPHVELFPVPVGELYQELFELYRERFAEAGLRFDVEPLDASVSVLADRPGLLSALIQLLDNALVHAAPKASVHMGVELHGSHAVLSVWNSGSEIEALDLERIFEPFGMLTREGGRGKQQGLGVGLALCRQTIQAFGGKVWASSSWVHGTTFFVDLACAA